MVDTCQANTMYSKIYSPNILATGSSELGENSYSVSAPRLNYKQVCLLTQFSDYEKHENDNDIGVAVIDSYTHHVLQFMEGINKTSRVTMQDLVRII